MATDSWHLNNPTGDEYSYFSLPLHLFSSIDFPLTSKWVLQDITGTPIPSIVIVAIPSVLHSADFQMALQCFPPQRSTLWQVLQVSGHSVLNSSPTVLGGTATTGLQGENNVTFQKKKKRIWRIQYIETWNWKSNGEKILMLQKKIRNKLRRY